MTLGSDARKLLSKLFHARARALGLTPVINGHASQPTTEPHTKYECAVDRRSYTAVPGAENDIPTVQTYLNWYILGTLSALMFQSIAPSEVQKELSEEDRVKRQKAHLNAFHRCMILALKFPEEASEAPEAFGHITIWYGQFVSDFRFHVTIYADIDPETRIVGIDCSSHFGLKLITRGDKVEFQVEDVTPDPAKPSLKPTCEKHPELAKKVEAVKAEFIKLVQNIYDDPQFESTEEYYPPCC